ncbi:hypothetical protein L4174_021225 [Photobacterium sp. CCB-ST2H9]|uniref:hypothetical protein n=1 Tax=Photobacterium sp. CCB-ST2H9 TaxID=2912855 RepID=UPI002003255F|nr:hypothetical protein [Photobacterium sp. CCB-ST2H9]UTM59230.1 hypothetical protein L4174_021225 [Photobacterium sp. CCB-ST2H9]
MSVAEEIMGQRKMDQTQKQDDITLAALEIVIDGVASSNASVRARQAGAYIAGLIMADMKGQLDAKKQAAILSIVEMAAEIEGSDCFRY